MPRQNNITSVISLTDGNKYLLVHIVSFHRRHRDSKFISDEMSRLKE